MRDSLVLCRTILFLDTREAGFFWRRFSLFLGQCGGVVLKSEYTEQQKNLVFRCNSFIFLCTKNCLNCLHRCTLSVPPYEISIQLLCTHPGKFDRALSIWKACNVWAGNFPASLDTIIHKGVEGVEGVEGGGLPAEQKYTNSLVAGNHR